jgi:LysR family glycine cleavage system transcriptional activator
VGCTQHGNLKFIELNASLSVIEMAKTGQGVALAREQLVLNDLAQGRLIRLYPEHALSSQRNYYIVTPKQASPAAQVLANWLQIQLTQ